MRRSRIRACSALAPAATALSTPLFYLPTGDFAVTVGVFVAASLLTGFGSGFMWVMWGEYYAKITQEDAEFLAPVSAVVAAVLVLVVSSMSGWVAVAVVTLLPLASGACLAFSWRDVQGQEATAEHWGVFEQRAYNDARDRAQRNPFGTLRAMGRGGLGVMVACLFVCVEGTFYAVPDKTSWPFQFVFVVSIAFMVVVAVASTMGPRRIAMSFLYRWMCPVLVVGFASVVLFGPDVGGYCAYVVSIAARFAFILITQLYFARFAATGKATAVQSFGFGWIFVHLGDFLGVVASVLLGEGVLQGLEPGSGGCRVHGGFGPGDHVRAERRKSFGRNCQAGMAQAGCGPDAFGPMGGAAALQRADGQDGAGSLSAGEGRAAAKRRLGREDPGVGGPARADSARDGKCSACLLADAPCPTYATTGHLQGDGRHPRQARLRQAGRPLPTGTDRSGALRADGPPRSSSFGK